MVQNLDNGLNSCAIFLDLAKAFDSVSHDILLRKLEYYGIRGKALNLFRSYLQGRSQYVKINNTSSSLIDIIFGVPQGSILGPLLFLIFINDLPDATNFYVKLFADDTFLCTQNNDFDALEKDVNFELKKVYSWLASNRLTLNISKSKYMLISKKRTIPKINISLNGTPMQSCDSYKYLGVYFDKDLNWQCHIDYITNKITKSCGALAKVRHCIDTNTLVNVYHALVNSYIRYGMCVWGGASQNILKPLKTVVNKAVRIISFAPFGNLDLKPAYQHLKLLSVENTYKFEIAKFTYKSKHNLLPMSIGNLFDLSSEHLNHNYFVRNRQRPIRVLCKSKTGEKSVQYKSFHLWNSLPSEIKDSESFNIFKKAYKTFLINS